MKRKNPGRFRHSQKWDDCVRDVKAAGSAKDAYSVCTASLKRAKNPSDSLYVVITASGRFVGYDGLVSDENAAKLFYSRDQAIKGGKAAGLKKPARIVQVKDIARAKNPRGAWVIVATKKRGGRYYYAGGARLASELKEAIIFPSVIHAETVKHDILSDFPRMLTKNFHWLAQPLPA